MTDQIKRLPIHDKIIWAIEDKEEAEEYFKKPKISKDVLEFVLGESVSDD